MIITSEGHNIFDQIRNEKEYKDLLDIMEHGSFSFLTFFFFSLLLFEKQVFP